MANPRAKQVRDNRANQLNPAHPAYYRSRGASPDEAAQLAKHNPAALDNHANQLNPNHEATKTSGHGEVVLGSPSPNTPATRPK